MSSFQQVLAGIFGVSATCRRAYPRHAAIDRTVAKARLSGRNAAARRRIPLCETLETRRALAIDLEARFEFATPAGSPVTSLQVGSDFLLRTYVRDVRAIPGGVKQAYFDITYSTSVATVTGAIDHSDFFSGGPQGQTATPGLIDDVGGRDPDLPPDPPGAEELLFTLPMRAIAAGRLTLSGTLGSGLTFFFDTVVGLGASNVRFSGGAIDVVGAGITVSPTTGLTLSESGQAANFSVKLDSAPTANVTIPLSSSDTSEAVVSPASLTFTPQDWQTPKTVTVTGVNDDLMDGPQPFTVVIGAASSSDFRYAGVNPADPTGANADNDIAALSVSVPTINETNVDQVVSFAITVDKAVVGGFVLDFTIVNGGATAPLDYVVNTVGPLSFTGTAGESRNIAVTIKGDVVIEPSETFSLSLDRVVPISPVTADRINLPSPRSATIVDDDVSLAITATDSTKQEGSSGTTAFVFSVVRSGRLSGATSVSYLVGAAPGSSVSVADFGGSWPSGTVTFAANESGQSLSISVVGDTIVEADESFLVVLSGPSGGAQIGTGSALGTILDDDTTVTLSATDASKSEGNAGTTAFSFTATRNGLTTASLTLNYAVVGSGGTPADAADFGGALPSGVVSFAANESSKTIVVNVSADLLVEADEGFAISLLNPSGGTAGGSTAVIATALGTVRNDDSTALSLASLSRAEGAGGVSTMFRFAVALGQGVASGFDLPFTVSAGNATLADDFVVATVSPLRFTGSSNETLNIDVTVNGDATLEPDESFQLSLGAPANLAAGIVATRIAVPSAPAIGTIVNDDAAVLAIQGQSRAEGDSGTTILDFPVTLSNAVANGFDLPFTINAGTSAAGTDFSIATTSPLRFSGSAGETKTIRFQVVGDSTVELDENFSIVLGQPANLAAGIASTALTTAGSPATAVIANDDSAVISVDDVAVTEGDSGVVALVFPVRLSRPVDVAVQFSYATVDGTATAITGDYQSATGTVTFVLGGSLTGSVTVSVAGDLVAEPSETFRLALTGLTAGTPTRAVTLARNEAQGRIDTDDGAALSIADARMDEGQSGTRQMLFTVTLSRPISAPFSVPYSTVDGLATVAGGDFGAATGQLTFSPGGPLSQTIGVVVNGDTTVERDEDLNVALGSLVGAPPEVVVGRSSARGVIQNDDSAVIRVLPAELLEGDAGSRRLDFSVELSQPVDVAIEIPFSTADGTARADRGDYQAASGSLRFAPGEPLLKTVSVNVTGDLLVEPNESFTLNLGVLGAGTPPRSVTVAAASALGTLVNDDDAQLTISAGQSASEESVAGSFLIASSRPFQSSVAVGLNLSGTASSGVDFASIGTSFIFPANATSATLSVTSLADNLIEGNETVTVGLAGVDSASATVGAANAATISIFDNDSATVVLETGRSLSEAAGAQSVRVLLATSNGSGGTAVLGPGVQVRAELVDDGVGTAASLLDYAPLGVVSVLFSPGAGDGAAVNVAVSVINDTLIEGRETLQLRLRGLVSTFDGRVALGAAGVPIAITDNDKATLAVNARGPFEESAGTQPVTVTLTTSDGAGGSATLGPGVDIVAELFDAGGGTATAGADYMALAGREIRFAAGAANGSTASTNVTIINDALIEGPETMRFGLRGLANAHDGQIQLSPTFATFDISDNDSATISIENSRTLAEAGGLQTVTLTLATSDGGGGTASLGPGVMVTVDVVDAGQGTATGGLDYASVALTSVAFPSGAGNGATATTALTLLNDSLVEGLETLRLSIRNPRSSNVFVPILGNSMAVLTIADNDTARISFVTNQTLSEAGGTQTLVATLAASNNAGGPATLAPGVSLAIDVVDLGSGTATTGVDYLAFGTRTLTFAAGSSQGATSSFTFSLTNDALIEGPETLQLKLQNLNSTRDGQVSFESANASVSIVDNDTATLALETAKEIPESGTAGVLLVTLQTSDGAGGQATMAIGVVIRAEVVDANSGTASRGVDYAAFAPVAVTFASGASQGATATVSVAAFNDSLVEGPETLRLSLRAVAGATSAPGTVADQMRFGNTEAVVTIVDNDTATLSLDASAMLSEQGGTQSINVRLSTSDGAGGTATLAPGVTARAELIDVGGGTAVSGLDYVAISGLPVVFPAGATQNAVIAVSVNPLNDNLVEGQETVRLRLRNSTAGGQAAAGQTLVNNTILTATIADNDTASLSIEANKRILESGSAQSVLVTLSTSDGAGGAATLGPGVKVSARVVDAGSGTASSGIDYVAIGQQTVEFTAGDTQGATRLVAITPRIRTTIDPPRTLRLRLEGLEGLPPELVKLGNTASLVTIEDAPPNSQLHGFAYIDVNGNGQRDSEEMGIPGVTVSLSGQDVLGRAVSLSTITKDDGSYRFEGLVAGAYTLRETQPAAFHDGVESTTAPNAKVGNDSITGIPLGLDQVLRENNFGERGLKSSVLIGRSVNASAPLTPARLRELMTQAERASGKLSAVPVTSTRAVAVAARRVMNPAIVDLAMASLATVNAVDDLIMNSPKAGRRRF